MVQNPGRETHLYQNKKMSEPLQKKRKKSSEKKKKKGRSEQSEIKNGHGQLQKASIVQHTGNTRYGWYRYAPNERVWYQSRDNTWRKGKIILVTQTGSFSYWWVVKLRKGEENDFDHALGRTSFGYRVFDGQSLIPVEPRDDGWRLKKWEK
jgi:hypothetical protein